MKNYWLDKNELSFDEALQLAATAWCDEENKNTVMDPNLAKSFAKILVKQSAKRKIHYIDVGHLSLSEKESLIERVRFKLMLKRAIDEEIRNISSTLLW